MKRIAAVIAMCAVAISAQAQEKRTFVERHGDWSVYVHVSGSFVAETQNVDGAVFGTVCAPTGNSCYWAIISKSKCADNGVYPILVNAASGSFTTNGICHGGANNYTMTLDNFDGIVNTIVRDGMIGFATPLENGLFYVTRFSLSGATKASMRAGEYANAASRHRAGDSVL